MKRTLSAAILTIFLLSFCLTACIEETEPEIFINSWDYTYILQDDGTAEITNFKGKDEILTLPSRLDHHSITAIGDNTFRNCSSLTSINIPDSVISFGDRVFYKCSNLTLTVGRNSYAAQYCKENG